MRLTALPIAILVMSCSLVSAASSPSRAAEPDKISLGGGITLTTYAAQVEGFYARQNLAVTIARTGSSDALRAGIVSGKNPLVDFSVDNALAMADKKVADVVVLMGEDHPPIQFIGNKGMGSVDQVRGKTILVDSPVTQNAVIMKRILAKDGLEPGRDYQMKSTGAQPGRLALLRKDPALGGTMVSWPEFFEMRAEGYPAFGSSVDVIGPTLFHTIFTTREWASAHKGLVERFLAAQLESERWMMNPGNKDAVIALLRKRGGYTPEVAAAIYKASMGPNGWIKDGAIPLPELANVMKLRAEIEGGWGGKPPPPQTYVDLSYLDDARERLDRR